MVVCTFNPSTLEAEASLVYKVNSRTARHIQRNHVLKNKAGGWRDGLVVKSTDCLSEGPEFKPQQPSIMRSDALFLCV